MFVTCSFSQNCVVIYSFRFLFVYCIGIHFKATDEMKCRANAKKILAFCFYSL